MGTLRSSSPNLPPALDWRLEVGAFLELGALSLELDAAILIPEAGGFLDTPRLQT
jgi:hypothetical protein